VTHFLIKLDHLASDQGAGIRHCGGHNEQQQDQQTR
jgi:hypothetical protein